ncbi:MAG: hypothetical protein Q8W51_05200 [Candidatus Palauibacterales bacterium]|nr:hypothetical protein [Candidatus Palauibacterales bacterium]MDP2529113.1 hypothetical protein [Candidatus Palauibacterales bacterium]MDP2583940.1 hypothetical protein [Candidatus Palauibacterales bacterium]
MSRQPISDGAEHGTTDVAARRGPRPGGGKTRRIAFWSLVVLTTALVLVSMVHALPLIAGNWLPRDAWLALRSDRVPGDQAHRLHSLALALLAWGMLAGVALQFHRPRRKVAALLVALAVPIAIAAAEALIGTYSVAGTAPFILPILLACILHPAARELVRRPHLDRTLVILTLVAGVAWIAYALSVAERARATVTPFEVDHLEFMVSLGLLAVLWGLIAATDKPGWRFAAVAVLFLTACVALQSLIFPAALSGLSPFWAWAALTWCVAFGAAAWTRGRVAAAP